MGTHLLAYATTAAVFLVIDYVWLAHLARGFYADRLGHLLLERPNVGAAVTFYAIYVAGIVFFATLPALKSGSASSALVLGALFGFFAYATYDMTNYATLKGWPLAVVMVDVAWGTVLSGLAALAGFHATRLLLA
ncbi:MAG: DUF2177 family protein [Rhodobiaceae bacterium]|nr:DUF2177 family protein [Rhodobiaceae bacterium]MCC0018178.1 DUF2177 family protein [Rhodobiaceae bacterium]MCC0051256.1 DUF2177 family protein [Rhodobiaceae bacterium]MCC0053085.1 DUF2177 family protein [Rhodobiaceae bacterium]